MNAPDTFPEGSPHSRRAEFALFALAVIATALWLPLHRFYGLRSHWDIQYFAFDKVIGQDGEPPFSRTLQWTALLFALLGLIYMAGWVLVARLPRLGLPGKVAVGLAGLGPGVINIDLFPVGALDVFRYMVALKQALHYGENPYTQGFTAHKDDPFAFHAFLQTLPNAKGPAWLLLSAPAAWLGGFDDPLRMLVALKAYNLGLIALTAWLASRFFVQPRRQWLAGYAIWANPLVLFEGVGNGHNDVMIALLVVAALLALRRGSWLAMPLLALSALVKYFTLQLGPLFLIVMLVRRWPWRTVVLSLVAAAAVSVAAIAPFWDGGKMVDGIQDVGDAYNRSRHVSIISLVRQYRIRDMTTADARKVSEEQPLFAVITAALSLPLLWRSRRGRHVEETALDLTLLFMLLLSLLYPWYLITTIAILAVRRDALAASYLLVGTLLALVYYPASVWAWKSSGLDRLHIHLYLSIYLTLPILAFWLARGGRWWLRRRALVAP